ncbi:TetR/AcrR family transcriptional regulator [Parasphingopyxis sp.]|uniref:TetR/AcrR family transcriptional regulator n=1 Tax=Parasphingopyxis sp. TaxID=1920299 RepID=UPI00262BE3F5|nr:TetR/AcrR family transcriptional regulator [Parasphingopyxis sp.]
MTDSIRPNTKDAIVEAAFDVLRQDPSAPLSAVADRAGVGRATLHRYFASREALIHALALIAIEEMDAAAEAACADAPSYAEAFRNMLAALIPLGDRHGFLATEPVESDPAIAAEFERQTNETREMIDAAKQDGLFDPAVPTDWIVQAFDHLLYAAWESVKAGEITHQQAADLAWRTLESGLGTGSQ